MITTENYLYSGYSNRNLSLIISLCSSPEKEEFYSVAVLDENQREVSIKDFDLINQAIEYANKKYSSIWEFKNMAESQNEGSCSTCVAH